MRNFSSYLFAAIFLLTSAIHINPDHLVNKAPGQTAVVPAPGLLSPEQLRSPGSAGKALQPLVVAALHQDVSPALASLPIGSADRQALETERPFFQLPRPLDGEKDAQPPAAPDRAPAAVDLPGAEALLPAPEFNFDGLGNLFGGYPPDTQGDIGPSHYVQWINLHFAIWAIDRGAKTAQLVYGPVPGKKLFEGFGGVCETSNDGDPITLFDAQAGRWFMSQFALPNFPYGPFYQCVAVSQTDNPLGSWYRYQFQMPVNKMNDYPKFGIWPDAYYMTVNQFNAGSTSWGGAGVAALERHAMLQGSPARMVYFDLYSINSNFGGMLPADVDGNQLPPPGSPGYFAEWDDAAWLGPSDALRIWEFHVNWADPGSSSFGLAGQPNQVIDTLPVDPDLCSYSRECIPQPGTSRRLDAISDRLMYRLQYRNFGGYETLVTNHSVDVNGANLSGIHWMEIRRQGGAWAMHQEGVYAPDNHHRWMGSAALDHVGNMALGYSVSSASLYPSVRYTGRLASDPMGELGRGEQSLVEGGGAQTGSARWGDYSMMGVDPLDDCTFWYTQEYVAVTGTNTWKTRIGAFRFPNCSIGPIGVLKGVVRASGSGDPIQGATVQASSSPTSTLSTRSQAGGGYQLALPEGLYQVTASAFGYYSQTVSSLAIISGTETVQDFDLLAMPAFTISGVLRDSRTGWPLYGSISVDGASVAPVWTHPVSGQYSLTLPSGFAYTLSGAAFVEGYQAKSVATGLLDSDRTIDIDLGADLDACDAPGYAVQMNEVFAQDFEANNGGMTVSGNSSWAWGTPTSGPGSAHSGQKAWATNLAGLYNNNESGSLVSPVIDLSAHAGEQIVVRWRQWLSTELNYDRAYVEASTNGGTTWDTIYGPVSGAVDLSWARQEAFLPGAYATANFRLRFRLATDVSVTDLGWYLDDLAVGPGGCQPSPGGLVVGNVYDANTSQGLTGARVSAAGRETTTASTPADDALEDGFYTLFAPAGSQVITATQVGGYHAAAETVNVVLSSTVGQDLSLLAGWLDFDSSGLEVHLELGDVTSRSVQLVNSGGIAAAFSLYEIDRGSLPLGPFQEPLGAVKPFRSHQPTSQGLGVGANLDSVPLISGAGVILRSWLPQGLVSPWAVAYDSWQESVWVSSPIASWNGNDRILEYSLDGAATGRGYLHDLPHQFGPADLAYNWFTGRLWVMNISTGLANCIYEIDPASGYTGRNICPGGGSGFAISQRGLAYDPQTDTWFAGGWNDRMVYRFDDTGAILSQVNVNLPVAGLAYNALSGHLFVSLSDNLTRIVVLDVNNSYQAVGQFDIGDGLPPYAGGGLEIDCDGNLWTVDQVNHRVLQVTSGESSNVCSGFVDWLDEEPTSGAVPAIDTQPITVTLNAGVAVIQQPGVYRAWIKAQEDTPYLSPRLPVTMTVAAPATWGKLAGQVTDLGYCDLNPAPFSAAQVWIESSVGISWTLAAAANGAYQWWLDQAYSPVTVTFSAPGYLPYQTSDVQVQAGVTTTLDAALHRLQPCVRADPLAIDETVKLSRTVTAELTLANLGYLGSTFQITEGPDGEAAWLSAHPASGILGAQDTQVVQVSMEGKAIGQHDAWLNIVHQDANNNPITIPITLTVLPLEYGVALGNDAALAEIPGMVVTYTLWVTNTSEGWRDWFNLTAEPVGPHGWLVNLDRYQVGPLEKDQSAQVQARVRVPAGAIPGQSDAVRIRATSQGDPTKTATLVLTTSASAPSADLEVIQMASAPTVTVGSLLTYTLTITNNGPTSALRAILVDVLPSRVIFVSSSQPCDQAGAVLSCALGNLAVGERRTIHLLVLVVHSGWLVNQAVITADAPDPQPQNNWATLVNAATGYALHLPLVYR